MMISQNMADILAKKAFDALAKFLDPINVRLGDPPGAVGSVGWPRLEFFNFLLHAKIPRDVSDQIPDAGESPHRLDGDRLVDRNRVQPGHAHKLRHAIDFSRTRTALA